MTEPAERSLIGDHATERERVTAYGLYQLMARLLVLPGAVLFGTTVTEPGSLVLMALGLAGRGLARRRQI